MRDVMNKKGNVKEFLESANEALLESKRHNRRAERLSLRCAALVRQNGIGRASEKLEELWTLLEEERVLEIEATRREMAIYRDVDEFISRIGNPVYQKILRRRYLEMGLTWVQIQQRLYDDGICYSDRQITRIYRQAMEEAERIWKEIT